MTNTSGFYKRDVDGQLYYAPNCVYHKDYILTKEDKNLKLPIDGWQWYDTVQDAKTELLITEKEETQIIGIENSETTDKQLCDHCGQVILTDI